MAVVFTVLMVMLKEQVWEDLDAFLQTVWCKKDGTALRIIGGQNRVQPGHCRGEIPSPPAGKGAGLENRQ